MATVQKNTGTETGVLREFHPEDIRIGKWHKRKERKRGDAKFDELVQSMKLDGVIEPVVVRLVEHGTPELLAGTRRLSAVKAAGLASIPCYVRENISDQQAKRITLAENLHREDLTPLEESETVHELVESGLTYEAIAAEISRTPKWVALRDNLRRLSPAWKKAVADPAMAVSYWPAVLLQEVAKIPHEMQDDLRELKFKKSSNPSFVDAEDELPLLGEFRKELAERFHLLSLAGWDLADPKVAKSCGACNGCPARSDHTPELFTVEDFETYQDEHPEPGVRCLNGKCWDLKSTSHIKHELSAAKPGELMLVSDRYHTENFDGKPVLGSSDYREATKDSPGAVRALVVDGSQKGQTIYIKKPGKGNGKSATTSRPASTAKPKSLAERRKNRARLLLRVVVGDLILQIDDIVEGKAEAPRLLEVEKLAIVTVFGTDPVESNRAGSEQLQRVDERGKLTLANLIGQLFVGALCKLRTALLYAKTADNLKEPEIRIACHYVGLDYNELFEKAVEAKPEPKSWAHLKADGTPKKAPSPIKNKAAAKKSSTKKAAKPKGKPPARTKKPAGLKKSSTKKRTARSAGK